MTGIENENLCGVTGGNAVLFSDGQPVCPVCGAMGTRMKIIESAFLNHLRRKHQLLAVPPAVRLGPPLKSLPITAAICVTAV